MTLSHNVQRVQPSVTMQISARAAALKREGIDVIALSAGEPDFDTPDNIKGIAIKAIENGFTKYTTPSSGIIELKEAICAKFKRDNGLEYTPDAVTVNSGAKHSLFLAVAALLNPGDEVVIPTPYWVTYSEQPRLVGAEPVIVETRPENGLKLTADEFRAAITPNTRMLFLCSPSNPSGAVYTREELHALAEVAVQHGIFVLSDEIYEKLVYDGVEHVSIAALGDDIKDLTIVVNGVSKAYAMTGWRIGYAGASAEIINGMNKVQMQEVSHPSSISQKAAVEALNGQQESIEEMRVAFDARRRYMVDRLNVIDNVHCTLPQGAFYAYPDVSRLYGSQIAQRRVTDSVTLCEYLLEEGRVACVPGAGFGTQEHIRLSYATSMELIEQAMDRIDDALKKLG
ncbi:MAG: aspartate aminotransferase [Gemmatimonadetes bacterium]|nr:aspartate aminotransferase [Gemmatimonadota bacterium]|tara:strand:+ start:747 stop:1943 length:1197 start_codon:yes stop_codon:yes gene_type:complete